tara:strand:+ start:24291 stop:24422 length:132 start_codon:yes stop_codon:yes gene_type:complete
MNQSVKQIQIQIEKKIKELGKDSVMTEIFIEGLEQFIRDYDKI